MIDGGWSVRARAELVRALVAKEFKARYKSAALGSLWAVINPLVLMAVLSVVFGRLVPMEPGRYPLFLLAGLVPWSFFSSAVRGGAAAVIENANLVRKVAFPRVLLPLAATVASLLHFSIALGLLVVIAALVRGELTAPFIALPLVIALQLTFVAGCAMALSVAEARWRDVRYVIDAALLVGFYATPVIYPLAAAPAGLQKVLACNPVAVHLALYRAALVDGAWPPGWQVGAAVGTSAAALLVGGYLFGRAEPVLADLA